MSRTRGGGAQSPTLGGAGRTVVGGGGMPRERPHGWLSRLFGTQVDENTVLSVQESRSDQEAASTEKAVSQVKWDAYRYST